MDKEQVIAKIKTFAKPDDISVWAPVPEQRILQAISLVDHAATWPYTYEAVPGYDGELQLIMYLKTESLDLRLEYTFEYDDTITLLKEEERDMGTVGYVTAIYSCEPIL